MDEQFADMKFPLAGISLLRGFEDQRPVPVRGEEQWHHTARVGNNVRACEALGQRLRGGSRNGLSRYVPEPVVANWILQNLSVATYITEDALQGGSMVQLSQAGRVVTLTAVSQGNVYVCPAGQTSWTAATNNTGDTPPLIYTGVLFSTVLNQKVWFADGVNWVYYDPRTNTVERWAASAGTLPVDTDGNRPRLICTWRGRMVLSGLLEDPQNWFMSKIGDPTNFDYAPLDISPDQAIAGNNSPMGLIGDVVTALIPYNDDVLIVGGDHTLYVFAGDPMAGGQIDLISDAIGVAWGQAWCKDPYGTLYFFSNRTGIYSLIPGEKPVRISQQIEQLLLDVDTGSNSIRLVWDDRYQGFHVFITPLISPTDSRHFFYEQRTGAWWTTTFVNPRHSPLTVATFDGNLPGDRVALIGSWDGYVRSFDPDAEDDDGEDILSEVLIGPLVTKELDDILLKDLQAVLGEDSGEVEWEVYTGTTAEIALLNEPVASGVWSAGRNYTSPARVSGHAIYLRLSSKDRWSMETVRARLSGRGKVRRRGR